MARRKGQQPEYVVICREFNRKMARIDITVIDSGVTEQLLKRLCRRGELVRLRRLERILRYSIHHELRHGMGGQRTGAGLPAFLAGGHL